MATLVTRIGDLATRIATENKALRTLLNGNLSDLTSLSTTAKTNVVAALNEIVGRLDDIETEAATINDAATSSTTETWSVTKIASSISNATTAVKNEILGGAGAAYDTLQELKALLDESDSDISSLTTALGLRVRVDTAAQGLTTLQQTNARTNIAAIASADIGNPDTNFVTGFEAGLT